MPDRREPKDIEQAAIGAVSQLFASVESTLLDSSTLVSGHPTPLHPMSRAFFNEGKVDALDRLQTLADMTLEGGLARITKDLGSSVAHRGHEAGLTAAINVWGQALEEQRLSPNNLDFGNERLTLLRQRLETLQRPQP